MFTYENQVLNFIINKTQVEVGPFSADFFNKKTDVDLLNENFDEAEFRTNLVVSEAISKLVNEPVRAIHQSGNVAYEAWYRDGSFCGNFTVYSDYVSLHSIDAGSYRMLKSELERKIS